MADAPFAPPALESKRPVPRPALGYALVWSAVVLWSLNAVISKVVLESTDLSSLRLAEVRATGAALILVVGVALVRAATLRTNRRELGFLVVFGVLGLAFVQLFYFVGIQRLDIGIALVINYLAPVFVALWARFYVHEPVRRRLWLAIALSLLGLSLVVQLWGGGSSLDGVGVLACLVTAVAYAAYVLMAERSLESGRDVYSLLAWGFTFAALFWAVFQPWWSFPVELVDGSASLLGRFADVSVPVWLLLAYIVVLGTVVPFVLLVSALHHVPATRVTIVAMLEPVLAAIVAWIWLGEELAAVQMVGGLIVLVGVVLAQTARSDDRDDTHEDLRKMQGDVAVSPPRA
ncbi:MAG TPA: EamA family transporter [Gaiellaceae bacterium]|nr:EamA family transporter [Gaiellaceae bacterium]